MKYLSCSTITCLLHTHNLHYPHQHTLQLPLNVFQHELPTANLRQLHIPGCSWWVWKLTTRGRVIKMVNICKCYHWDVDWLPQGDNFVSIPVAAVNTLQIQQYGFTLCSPYKKKIIINECKQLTCFLKLFRILDVCLLKYVYPAFLSLKAPIPNI